MEGTYTVKETYAPPGYARDPETYTIKIVSDETTQRLLSCSELLGVKMLDHIIVGGETGNMLSFKGIGLLDQLRPTRSVWER